MLIMASRVGFANEPMLCAMKLRFMLLVCHDIVNDTWMNNFELPKVSFSDAAEKTRNQHGFGRS